MSTAWKPVLLSGLLVLTAALSIRGATSQQIEEWRRIARTARPVARRRAARKILAAAPARGAIMELVHSKDRVIKRAALRRLVPLFGTDASPILRTALADKDALVRIVAVEELLALRPRPKSTEELLLRISMEDPDMDIRKIASSAFWTFHRNVVPLRKRTGWDHVVEVVARMPLPKQGWRFRMDPGRTGHVSGWFASDLDEKGWLDIEIERFWHDALPEKVGHFEGVAWYRKTLTFPAKPDGKINEVVLHFDAVDESTWLWINGQYAGLFDIGPSGWRTAFDIDITPFVRWGQSNQITVRVLNTAAAGGVWKPVEFQVLR